MIDSLFNVFFRCAHRRTTFPRRPPGADDEEMYIVCLDCGKRFHYDWERMRIEKPKRAPGSKTGVRYFVAALSLPVLWLIGKAWGSRRSKSGKEH
jgi:hypothetical protein